MYVNQSIHRPQGVNVFGSFQLRATADYASVRFSVNRTAAHPKEAFESVRGGAKTVRECVRAMKVDDADVAASDTSLREAFTGDYQNRKKVGYTAAVDFHVLVRDLSKLEALLAAVVDAGADTIVSVHAKSSRIRELRSEARKSAVRSARAKAEELAAAAGAKLGPVLHLEDVNADELGRRSHAPDVDLAAHSDEAATKAENPGSITVSAAVMACFGLIAG